MARENFILKTILETGEVTFNPHGNSMVPKIYSGEQVIVKQVSCDLLKVDDIVYVKIKGSYYLHLLSAIDKQQDKYQISNNHGHVNGWASSDNIFGICVRVGEKVLLSEDDLQKRIIK